MSALRALLAGIVDYAGLFPPAGLDMPAAVRQYSLCRADDASWMLGRFVVPVARLEEFTEALDASRTASDVVWPLTALVGQDVQGDIAAARAFNEMQRDRARIGSLEAKLETEHAIAAATGMSGDLAMYVEIAPCQAPALVPAIARAGMRAKIRTGGVTAEAFPSPGEVVQFIRACTTANVAFKATAGLHHPLRGEYPLTYEETAPRGVMFGFITLFLAAGFMAHGMSNDDALQLLDLQNDDDLHFTSTSICWGTHVLTAPHLRRMRQHLATSFGSCSFRDPVNDLRRLLLLS